MMKLHGSTKNKITKDKNGENVPHLEIYEVALLYSIVISSTMMIINMIQESCTHLFLINHLVNY